MQEDIARRQQAEALKQRQIKELMDEARRLYRERKYETAVETLKQVLAIEPEYELARWLRSDWEEMAMIQKEKSILQNMQTERQAAIIDADESMIPWHVYVHYPDNWPEINRRQDRYGAFQRMEDELTVKARRQLNELTPEIAFPEGTTFGTAVEEIATRAGINISVNWNALQQYGITPDTLVSLRKLTNVSWLKVLELLLQQVSASLGNITQLDWTIDQGVLTISTHDELSQNLKLQVYDIGDLLLPPYVVNPSGGFNMNMGGGTGGANGWCRRRCRGGGMGGGSVGGGGGGGVGGGGSTTQRRDQWYPAKCGGSGG